MSGMGVRKLSISNGSKDPLINKKRTTSMLANDPLVSQPFLPSLELTFCGHRSAVLAACFQPSVSSLLSLQHANTGDVVPRHVLSCGVDGLVFLWSSKTTVRALRFAGNRGPVHDCVWSPNAHLIASAGHDGFVRLWQPSLRPSGGPAVPVPYVKNSSSENCCLWRAHAGPVRALAVAPHDAHLYTAGDDKSVKCWDLNYASSLSPPSGGGRGGGNKFVSGFTGGHQNWVRTVAVSSGSGNGSGNLPTRIPLVASGGDDRTVQVWDPRSRRPTHTFFEHTNTVHSVDFHPDGCSLATGSADHTINLFDLRKNGLLQHYDAHDGCVNEVRFAPMGSWLLSASSDGKVKLWDLMEGYLYCTLSAHEGAVQTARFSDCGKCFTTAGQDGIVMVWRSGLPCMHPEQEQRERERGSFSYVTHPKNLPSSASDGQSRPILSASAAAQRNAEVPLPLASEAGSASFSGTFPCAGNNRGFIIRGGVDADAPSNYYCPIDTSKTSLLKEPREVPKPRNRETESKEHGGYIPPPSMTSSQLSFSSSQKPPLAQPLYRTGVYGGTNGSDGDGGGGGGTEMLSLSPSQDSTNKYGISGGGGGEGKKVVDADGRHRWSHHGVRDCSRWRHAATFAREDDEQHCYHYYKRSQLSEGNQNDKGGNDDKKRKNGEEYRHDGYQQRNHHQGDAAVGSIELDREEGNGCEAGTACAMDEEVSVLEYAENAFDDMGGSSVSGTSPPPPPIPVCPSPSGNISRECLRGQQEQQQQQQQYANDRMGRLEKAYARLTTEIELAQKRNADLTQQLQDRWDAQQQRQRGEIDQLRLIMEGLVAQQGALLQALRKE